MHLHVSRLMPVLFTVLGLVLLPDASRADEVDVAIDAFAAAGATVGVNLGATEKELAKTLVRCAAVQGKPLLACARDVLVSKLPAEARPFASCLVKGGSPQACGEQEVIRRLPSSTHGLATCIARQSDVVRCGTQFATDQAQKAAFATMEKLKVDAVARSPLTDTPGSIQNIIRVVEGIRQDDWAKVVRHGGTEVGKLAGKVIMRIFLPPPLAAALDPAVDALIQHRIDLFADIIIAAKKRDERRLGELVVEAAIYLNLPLVQACALLPSGTVKEVVCGTLGFAAKVVIDVGGEIASRAGRAAESGYNELSDFVTGRRDDCGTRWQYYSSYTALCLYPAALAKRSNSGTYAHIERSLNNRCRHHFRPCALRLAGSDTDGISAICNPVRAQFPKDVDEVSMKLRQAEARLGQAAAAYARSYPPVQLVAEIGPNAKCDRGVAVRKFVQACIGALNKQFRLEVAGGTCEFAQGLAQPNWVEAACQAVPGRSVRVDCRCPEGTVLSSGACVMTAKLQCPSGMHGKPPNCRWQAPPKPLQAKPLQKPCPLERTCVQWGKGAPGSLGGPCLRYEMRPQCPSDVR